MKWIREAAPAQQQHAVGSTIADLRAALYSAAGTDGRHRWWNCLSNAQRTEAVPSSTDWPTDFSASAKLKALFGNRHIWYVSFRSIVLC